MYLQESFPFEHLVPLSRSKQTLNIWKPYIKVQIQTYKVNVKRVRKTLIPCALLKGNRISSISFKINSIYLVWNTSISHYVISISKYSPIFWTKYSLYLKWREYLPCWKLWLIRNVHGIKTNLFRGSCCCCSPHFYKYRQMTGPSQQNRTNPHLLHNPCTYQ